LLHTLSPKRRDLRRPWERKGRGLRRQEVPGNPENLLELGEKNQWEPWTQPEKVKKSKPNYSHEVSKLLNPPSVY